VAVAQRQPPVRRQMRACQREGAGAEPRHTGTGWKVQEEGMSMMEQAAMAA
jgi:hypothetical protein